MASDSDRYRVFLLRVWRAQGSTAWRMSLEEPRSGKRYGFTDLSSLMAFLADQLGATVELLPADLQGDSK
jgi:hypothetical protein